MTTAARGATELVGADRLRGIARQILEHEGMSHDDAATTANALVWADLHGAHAQGAAMKVEQCVRRIRAGVTRADAKVEAVTRRGAFALLDANDAWGPVAATAGMREAISLAKKNGVGLAIVRNSSTGCGMGYYPMLAVAERLIGWTMNDSQPLQPAWGGKTRTLGNQAFAIGVPAGRHRPLLFDTATTAITLNAIEAYRDRGEQLPPGLVLDANGEPTIDPEAALAGVLLPMGGHRGSGLALMWEVLTGVLSGGQRFAGTVAGLNDLTQPSGVSFFHLAIDPAAAMPYETFTARVDTLVDQVHGSPPASGSVRVRAPGERGAELAEARERDGIPLPAPRAAKLRALAEEVGVAW
jgi:LDH2 family malate/lactate/ureidoglycolate dehydrogenase